MSCTSTSGEDWASAVKGVPGVPEDVAATVEHGHLAFAEIGPAQVVGKATGRSERTLHHTPDGARAENLIHGL